MLRYFRIFVISVGTMLIEIVAMTLALSALVGLTIFGWFEGGDSWFRKKNE